MKIEHERLGLSFDIPELYQRDAEAFFKAQREIRAGMVSTPAKELADAIVGFLAALKGTDVKPGVPEFTTVFQEFAATLRIAHKPRDDVSAPEYNGVVARSAARCGWLEGWTEADVGDAKPAAITWLAGAVNRALAEAYEIPGE